LKPDPMMMPSWLEEGARKQEFVWHRRPTLYGVLETGASVNGRLRSASCAGTQEQCLRRRGIGRSRKGALGHWPHAAR
jgi:hypothetical protein